MTKIHKSKIENKDKDRIIETVKLTITKRKLFENVDNLVLMVSGGCDSVALSYIIHNIVKNDKSNKEKNIAIFHLNHHIRGKDADRDAQFVSLLANHLGVKFFYTESNIKKIAIANNKNLEATAREYRYKLANKAIADWASSENIDASKTALVTAHNADDRIENFYMRSIVGTGPAGFVSINYRTNNVIHPLLDIEKSKLKSFVTNYKGAIKTKDGKLWCEDTTNKDTERFRAYVRENIVPVARKYNKSLAKNLCNTMNLIMDENIFLEKLVNETEEICVEKKPDSVVIKPNISDYDIVLQRRLAYRVLKSLLPKDSRINTSSVESIIRGLKTHNYTDNIQGNLIIHSNKRGLTITSADNYRQARNRK